MWIVFRDPKNVFLHLDKFVFQLVASGDIAEYQEYLLQRYPGGRKHEFVESAFHLQPFFTSSDGQEFYIRNFNEWQSFKIPQTTIAILEG